MNTFILLLVIFNSHAGLEGTTSISIRGFNSMQECTTTLATLKRSVPAEAEIKLATCKEGII